MKTLSRDLASAKSMAGLLGLDLALQLPTLTVHPQCAHAYACDGFSPIHWLLAFPWGRAAAATSPQASAESSESPTRQAEFGLRQQSLHSEFHAQSLFDATFPSSRCRRQAEAYPARSHSAGFYKHEPRLCMGAFFVDIRVLRELPGASRTCSRRRPAAQPRRGSNFTEHTLLRVWDCLALSDVPIRGALGFRGSGMRLPTSAEAEGPEASQLEPEEAENNGPRKARRVDATDAAVKRHAFVTIMGISPSKGARRAHHSAARDQSCGSRVPV